MMIGNLIFSKHMMSEYKKLMVARDRFVLIVEFGVSCSGVDLQPWKLLLGYIYDDVNIEEIRSSNFGFLLIEGTNSVANIAEVQVTENLSTFFMRENFLFVE
jgi:hypothetical protein